MLLVMLAFDLQGASEAHILLELFSSQFLAQKSWAEAPEHTSDLNKFISYAMTVLQDLFMNFYDIFIPLGINSCPEQVWSSGDN